ncbi:MAG TPA: response regulator transcription factor [Anaerolineales bacterium]
MEAKPDDRIRILIADDHPVVRDGLVAMLSTQGDFQVIGEAATGRETVSRALELRPDVLLLDLEMPDMDGVHALEEIRRQFPGIQVIVLTAFDTDERILSALKSGASGYLLKGVPRQEIFHAIRTVSQGGSLLQPVVTTRLLEHIRSAEEAQAPIDPLTEREREILQLVAKGGSNKQIAVALAITERTVKFHVSAILRKLNAANRAEAVQKALTSSLIEL